MKHFTLLLTLIANISFAQVTENIERVLDANSITWLGLDFTDVTLLESYDHEGFNNPEKIKNYYFREWNEIIFAEPEKYDMRNFFRKDEVITAMTETMTENEAIQIQKTIYLGMKGKPSEFRTDEELQAVLDKYTYKGLKGIGATLIVTEMNKETQRATGYVAFVDLETQTLLYAHKVDGKAGGFGFRNYWLRAFLGMYEEIDIQRWYHHERKKKR